MIWIKEKSPKHKWYEIIWIVKSQTDLGLIYYLVNDNYDFINLVKEYLNMIQARAEDYKNIKIKRERNRNYKVRK